MKHALILKTEMILPQDRMKHLQEVFAEQLKTGVVIIPPYFKAELINVPTGVEVIIESATPDHRSEFLEKDFNLAK